MSENDVQPDAVTKVARDLTAIEDLATDLAAQAIQRSDDKLMPGGLATVSRAPVANLEAWWYQHDASTDPLHGADEGTWEPPLQTLCFWSEQWRREHNAEYDQRPTITSEANFLRYLLPWAWANELHWDDFARDVRQARVRLENVLYAGRRVERSRVKCIDVDCDESPRLIKVYRSKAVDDRWKCPACKRMYDVDDYARAKAQHLASQGAERYVTMQDAREAIGRSDRTFRKWLRFWHVRSYRDELTGQVWVWWPDVRETDLATPKRKRGTNVA